MQRRQFVKRGFTALALSGLGPVGTVLNDTVFTGKAMAAPFRRIPLPVPPLFDAAANDGLLDLEVQTGTRSFFPGLETATLGYNGQYLGPTLRVTDGERVRLKVRNTLNESTTVHWHGLHVPAQWDGGPRQVIDAGAEWLPDFTVKQEAATLWYHPHALGRTGEHVYRGLAGFFIIEDEFSRQCPVPREYGIDDIPLVIQDRRFYEDGRFAYVTSGHDIMLGVVGNYLLVNGAIEPRMTVQRGVLRLRLLNGSNSSIYRLSFSDRRPFWVIASDGGFLERPEQVNSFIFTAGERYEVLVDFTGDRIDNVVTLDVEQWAGRTTFRALELRVGRERGAVAKVIDKLRPVVRIPAAESIRTRQFAMETVSPGGRLTINGRNMDITRIDATVELGSTEIWEIANRSRMMMQLPHSMHLHDVQFQVLERNGEPPPPLEGGWKDTVLVMPGEVVRIISRFTDYTGVYMFHCHMLEHEDNGMMGQFEVTG